MGYLVYILRCGDGTLYTGCTNDLPRPLWWAWRRRGRSLVQPVYSVPSPQRRM